MIGQRAPYARDVLAAGEVFDGRSDGWAGGSGLPAQPPSSDVLAGQATQAFS
jgi:hypothetical protein